MGLDLAVVRQLWYGVGNGHDIGGVHAITHGLHGLGIQRRLLKILVVAKVFSLVNELRIIKKVNLLKISTSLHGWYYDIKIDLGA